MKMQAFYVLRITSLYITFLISISIQEEITMESIRNNASNENEEKNSLGQIYCAAVSCKNARRGNDIPYELYSDIAVICYLEEAEGEHVYITPMTRSMMEESGLKEEEIREIAWRNTIKDKKAVLRPLADLLNEEEKNGPGLYVLSNEDLHFGAVTIFYPGLLSLIADEFDCDLHIIPSSIHECLIMPYRENALLGSRELRGIVKAVNDTEVDDEDILSYNIYRYSRSENCMKIDNL